MSIMLPDTPGVILPLQHHLSILCLLPAPNIASSRLACSFSLREVLLSFMSLHYLLCPWIFLSQEQIAIDWDMQKTIFLTNKYCLDTCSIHYLCNPMAALCSAQMIVYSQKKNHLKRTETDWVIVRQSFPLQFLCHMVATWAYQSRADF